MPDVIVNMSSIGIRAIIHFLCTLELTVQRHFCSILKHEYAANASISDGCRSLMLNCGRSPKPRFPLSLTFCRDVNRSAFYLLE